ncbi:MAG: 50S ribosomal protein L27, partial [Candidatus Magasanikbacteria bacterium CG10_big_fil_rev_8_21_14_0_10_36_16]
GQTVKTGMVLVRQRGSKIHQGKNVKKGKDDTLFTLTDGKVKFQTKKRMNFTGVLKTAKYLHVLPEEKK